MRLSSLNHCLTASDSHLSTRRHVGVGACTHTCTCTHVRANTHTHTYTHTHYLACAGCLDHWRHGERNSDNESPSRPWINQEPQPALIFPPCKLCPHPGKEGPAVLAEPSGLCGRFCACWLPFPPPSPQPQTAELLATATESPTSFWI